MRTTIKIAIAAASLAMGSMCGASASHASSDAPWCAVINLGMGDARWDCRYRTVEDCVPNVIAGDRGSVARTPTVRPVPVKRTYKHHD